MPPFKKPSGKQLAVASDTDQSQFITCLDVNEEEVRFEMALSATGVTAFQKMISHLQFERFTCNETFNRLFKQGIESFLAGAFFVIPLELAGECDFAH